jgi:hypothetical protein
MRAPGHPALKKGARLKRGAATQVMAYPRPGTKAVLVQTSRQLGVSLSSLLIGGGLGIAARLAGRPVAEIVSPDELRQYMRGHGSDPVGIELWACAPLISESSPTDVGRTQGGSMAVKTDNILELEDRAKKLEALVALLRDPALSDAVAKLFGDTQVSSTAIPTQYRNPHSSAAALTEAIREVAAELPRPFTASDVVGQLKQRQFVFRRPALDATRDCLYRLSRGKRRIFRILEMRQAGKPNKYALIS